jgi:hypothetical protein
LRVILLVEPQCRGGEHVEVNAALLLTARHAFPDHPVTFLAEESHLAAVRLRLADQPGCRFDTIRIPPRTLSEPRRLRQDAALVRQLLDYGRKERVSDLFLCSATSASIYALKWYGLFGAGPRITVVLHRNLASLASSGSCRPWHYPFQVGFALGCAGGRNLRYLVYGDFIRERAGRLMPRLLPRLMAIDHPYVFPSAGATPSEQGTVTFGFLGTARFDKGADLFFRLSEDIAPSPSSTAGDSQARFIVVGHLWDQRLSEVVPAGVEVASKDGAMVSRSEYEELAASLDYAVFCGQAEPYNYFASGALLDAFAFCKPLISLRTPMTEYCFQQMGDIGYLCDSYEELAGVVRSLLKAPRPVRYRSQCDNIRKNRAIFSPETVAKQLRAEYLLQHQRVP